MRRHRRRPSRARIVAPALALTGQRACERCLPRRRLPRLGKRLARRALTTALTPSRLLQPSRADPAHCHRLSTQLTFCVKPDLYVCTAPMSLIRRMRLRLAYRRKGSKEPQLWSRGQARSETRGRVRQVGRHPRSTRVSSRPTVRAGPTWRRALAETPKNRTELRSLGEVEPVRRWGWSTNGDESVQLPRATNAARPARTLAVPPFALPPRPPLARARAASGTRLREPAGALGVGPARIQPPALTLERGAVPL